MLQVIRPQCTEYFRWNVTSLRNVWHFTHHSIWHREELGSNQKVHYLQNQNCGWNVLKRKSLTMATLRKFEGACFFMWFTQQPFERIPLSRQIITESAFWINHKLNCDKNVKGNQGSLWGMVDDRFKSKRWSSM